MAKEEQMKSLVFIKIIPAKKRKRISAPKLKSYSELEKKKTKKKK